MSVTTVLCPCVTFPPCAMQCPCANPFMSGVCQRCDGTGMVTPAEWSPCATCFGAGRGFCERDKTCWGAA